jgi:hypothetical protein
LRGRLATRLRRTHLEREDRTRPVLRNLRPLPREIPAGFARKELGWVKIGSVQVAS